MKTLEEIKKEWEEKVIDILRAVHVHGVDGDFDGCDGLDKDPQSMSVQTATKRISKIIDSTISQTKQELIEEVRKWCEPDSGNNKAITNLKVFLEKLSNK